MTMTVATIRPLQRPVPLRQSVYDALIDLIVGGELPPGQHMVETDLARQLGVSEQPIREALHRMEAEGWVDLRPSQGAFVHVPTDSEVDELLDVRALLEAETARLAARPGGPGLESLQAGSAQLARLREICREGQAAAEAGEFGAAVAANNAFPRRVSRSSKRGNGTLGRGSPTSSAAGCSGYYRMVAPARGHGSWSEHAEMILAIEAGDPEKAQADGAASTLFERTRQAYHRPRPPREQPDDAHRIRGVRVVRVVDELDLAAVGHDVVRPVRPVLADDRGRPVGVRIALLGVGVRGVLLRVDRRVASPDEPVGRERQPELVRVTRARHLRPAPLLTRRVRGCPSRLARGPRCGGCPPLLARGARGCPRPRGVRGGCPSPCLLGGFAEVSPRGSGLQQAQGP